MRLLIVLAFLLLLAATAVAVAALPSSPDDDFFRSLDRDRDGDVDKEELARAIREANGGVNVRRGVELALAGDEDDQLLHGDLVRHWLALASLMDPERVREWLEHAVDLPAAVAGAFARHNFTGLDLPSLLREDECARTLQEMNVTLTRQQRTKLLGAIKLRMLNAGKPPHPPELRVNGLGTAVRCSVSLAWPSASASSGSASTSALYRDFPEVHKYRLLRRVARDDDLPENAWAEIYSGQGRSYSDRPPRGMPSAMLLYDYKLEAWNLMGKSEAVELHDIAPVQCNGAGGELPAGGAAAASSSLWVQWILLAGAVLSEFKTALMSLNAIVATVGLMYYYFKVLSDSGTSIALPTSSSSSSSTTALMPAAVPPYDYKAALYPTSHHNSSHHALTMLEKELEYIKRANSLTNPSVAAAAAAAAGGAGGRPKINLNRCAQCDRAVTRNTRHHCGECMRVFCIAHTAVQPHMVVGNKVLTACGVNSRCRCFACADMVAPAPSQPDVVAPAPSSSSWTVVKNRILVSRTLRVWKRHAPTSPSSFNHNDDQVGEDGGEEEGQGN